MKKLIFGLACAVAITGIGLGTYGAYNGTPPPSIHLGNFPLESLASTDDPPTDTAIFTRWRLADSLLGKDARYTDAWCDQAAAEIHLRDAHGGIMHEYQIDLSEAGVHVYQYGRYVGFVETDSLGHKLDELFLADNL